VAPTKNPAKAVPGQIDHGRFGYARVSTRGQALEVQLSALDAAAVAPASVFAEKKSGKAGSARPQWEGVRSRLRPGDTLVVSKLDRMGRDMREIMETAWSLQHLGAKLEILSGERPASEPSVRSPAWGSDDGERLKQHCAIGGAVPCQPRSWAVR
jgi:DNA invertase Pin-like site-specific DNA recombinase